jgi:CPA2 family monovalent cation:H+ antiporter-2
MNLLSAMNPEILASVLIGVLVVLVATVLKYFRQPYIIVYLLAGILIGKHGFSLITDEGVTHIMSEVGLILLLFFVGMKTSLPQLVKNIWYPLF